MNVQKVVRRERCEASPEIEREGEDRQEVTRRKHIVTAGNCDSTEAKGNHYLLVWSPCSTWLFIIVILELHYNNGHQS